MRFAAILAIVVGTWPRMLYAQHGTAENGYYPLDYHGDTFKGTVTSTDDATREIVLRYSDAKRGKTESLVCTLKDGYTLKLANGTLHEVKPSDIKLGAVIKVYYTVHVKKVNGKKTAVNTIFNIAGYPNQPVDFKPFN
jgi:hypothetical protein